MPWIKKELCDGCGICIDQCSVGAIIITDGIAFIQQDKCIRCAVCHDICPNDAVRHDGEKILEEVEANLAWAKDLLAHDYYSDDTIKQRQLIQRLKKFFTKNKKVAEKTIEQWEVLQNP